MTSPTFFFNFGYSYARWRTTFIFLYL